jgi:hypothetical protein
MRPVPARIRLPGTGQAARRGLAGVAKWQTRQV